jgi:hypothetical protein
MNSYFHDHCVSFKSCLARIPSSINSKYNGDIAEVIIIQLWDRVRAKSTKIPMTKPVRTLILVSVVIVGLRFVLLGIMTNIVTNGF